MHLRHEFSAEIYDAEAHSVFLTRDQRADVISSDEEVVAEIPRARPDVMPAEDGSDVAVNEECGAHVMETESLASAAEVYSEEEPLTDINGSESPPHLVAKMDLYPTSVVELQMFRDLYRQESCLCLISFIATLSSFLRFPVLSFYRGQPSAK